VLEPLVRPHIAVKIDAVHLRHADVGDDEVNRLFAQFLKCFFAVGGNDDLISMQPQDFCQKIQVHRIIINKQDFHFEFLSVT